MNIPKEFEHKSEWIFVGPLGPELPPSFLTHSLLGVDGGANFAQHLDVWVGDQDSYAHTPKARHVFKHPPLKDQSDLCLALSLFKNKKPYTFHLWGFLGGRRDHELFNLGEISSFLAACPQSQVFFYNQHGKKVFHFMAAGEWRFHHIGLFSLGALKEVMVELKGDCKYELPTRSVLRPLSSHGLSNESMGQMILINQGPVFFYFPEDE